MVQYTQCIRSSYAFPLLYAHQKNCHRVGSRLKYCNHYRACDNNHRMKLYSSDIHHQHQSNNANSFLDHCRFQWETSVQQPCMRIHILHTPQHHLANAHHTQHSPPCLISPTDSITHISTTALPTQKSTSAVTKSNSYLWNIYMFEVKKVKHFNLSIEIDMAKRPVSKDHMFETSKTANHEKN